MKKLMAACLMMVFTACGNDKHNDAKDALKEHGITIDICNGYTPVKDQASNGNCWMYGMLAAIETEHISRGDSIHLSVRYGMRKFIEDAATARYMSGGRNGRTIRGMAQDALYIIERYGAMPYDAYTGNNSSFCNDTAGVNDEYHDIPYAPALRMAYRLADKGARLKSGLDKTMKSLERALDSALGPCPPRVFMLGAEYTKGEFGRSICSPGEYMALASCTHHPFFEMMTLESGDNYEHHRQLNVPIHLLRQIILYAVDHGHGVCWQGDTSEPGFSFGQGVAQLPKGHEVTQMQRQKELETMETTDDHCMAIIGRAHDSKGRRYLIMKNSWGRANPFGGLMMVSEDYAVMKSMVVIVPVSCAQTCISSYLACQHHNGE